MKITVISNGMGTQSKLFPILLYEKHPKLKKYWDVDIILDIFSDTGDEEHSFYEKVLPEYKQYLKNNNYPDQIQLTRNLTHDIPEKSMTDYYINQKAIMTRNFRHCTDKFKIQVIRRYLRETYGHKHEYQMLIGFSYDTKELGRMRDSDVKWITNVFPYITDLQWNRERIISEMEKRGITHNYKTGCFDCPFLSFNRFYKNIKHDPIRKNKVLLMEKQALARNKEMTLFNYPLDKLIKFKEAQKNLGEWIDIDLRELDDTCESGHCFI